MILALGGALVGGVAAYTWYVPPKDLVSLLIWAPFTAITVALIGLFVAGYFVETTLRFDGEGIHARQWRFTKELPFARVKRIYLFRDGRQDKLAVVPTDQAAWFIGLGITGEELDAVCARLDAVAQARGIEFLRNVTFEEILEREDQDA